MNEIKINDCGTVRCWGHLDLFRATTRQFRKFLSYCKELLLGLRAWTTDQCYVGLPVKPRLIKSRSVGLNSANATVPEPFPSYQRAEVWYELRRGIPRFPMREIRNLSRLPTVKRSTTRRTHTPREVLGILVQATSGLKEAEILKRRRCFLFFCTPCVSHGPEDIRH